MTVDKRQPKSNKCSQKEINKREPYSLKYVKFLLNNNHYLIDSNVINKLNSKLPGWRLNDIKNAFLKLNSNYYYKTMTSKNRPYVLLDVYKKSWSHLETKLYTHFSIEKDDTGQDILVIDSFKEATERISK